MRRTDEAWLEQRWADPTTRVLVVAGTRVRPHEGRPHWVAPGEAPQGTRLLLGERAGVTWAAVLTPPSAPAARRAGWPCATCCRCWPTDAADEAPQVFHALGLAEWQRLDPLLPALRRPGWSHARPATSCSAPGAGASSSRAATPPSS